MPGEKKVKKLEKVVLVHCGNVVKEVVKPLEMAVDEHLNPEQISYRRKIESIEKLNKEVASVGSESVHGICVITPQLLKLLCDSSKDAVKEFEDGLLLKDNSGYPLFVCLKYNVSDKDIMEVLPMIYARDKARMLRLEPGSISVLCNDIYQQWFGSGTYVNDKGYHCVSEDLEQINCVHIVHAGEDRRLLNNLNEALEIVANPECNCKFRRRYREEDNIAEKIMDDVNQFVASCHENKQNKCMIIVSDLLIRVLKESSEVVEAIKKPILSDCYKNPSPGNIPNFVLLEMKGNDIFTDTSFWPIILTHAEGEDLEEVAKKATNIWFKPIRSAEESYYNSGEQQLQEARQQIQESTLYSAGNTECKVVPSAYMSGCNRMYNPQNGEMVCNPKSLVQSSESLDHSTRLNSQVTKSLSNGQQKAVYRDEIQKLEQKGFQEPKERIRSDNPDELMSNPPPSSTYLIGSNPPPIDQPVNPTVRGNVAVNGSSKSLGMKDVISAGKQNISYQTDVRNSNHCNEDASGKSKSYIPEAQAPSVSTPDRQARSFGTQGQQAANPDIPGAQAANLDIPGSQAAALGTPGVLAANLIDETQDIRSSAQKPLHDTDKYLSLQDSDIPTNNFGSLKHQSSGREVHNSGSKSLPHVTKPCPTGQAGGPENGGNISSFGPTEGKAALQLFDTTTTDKYSTNENSTESPEFKPDTNGNKNHHLVRGLNIECQEELILKLDLPIPCVHDWRNLAGHYGVPNATIHVWSGRMPHLSASRSLFKWLGAVNPDLTIETLKKDLANFRRRDVVKILENYEY